MIKIFKADTKQTKSTNKAVYLKLKAASEQYRTELDNYSDTVTFKILEYMYTQENYHVKGSLDSEIGKLLLNPPKLNDLSLPIFLGQTDKQGQGNHYEIVNLKYGYLFIYLESDCWIAQLHISNDAIYLDTKKSFKQTIPAIVRDTTVASGSIYQLIRLAKLFIK